MVRALFDTALVVFLSHPYTSPYCFLFKGTCKSNRSRRGLFLSNCYFLMGLTVENTSSQPKRKVLHPLPSLYLFCLPKNIYLLLATCAAFPKRIFTSIYKIVQTDSLNHILTVTIH